MKLNPIPVKCTNAAGMTFIQYDEYMGQGEVSASIGSHSYGNALSRECLYTEEPEPSIPQSFAYRLRSTLCCRRGENLSSKKKKSHKLLVRQTMIFIKWKRNSQSLLKKRIASGGQNCTALVYVPGLLCVSGKAS